MGGRFEVGEGCVGGSFHGKNISWGKILSMKGAQNFFSII